MVFDAQVAPTFDGRASAIAYAAFRQWRALGARRRRWSRTPSGSSRSWSPTARRPARPRGGPAPFFLRFDSAEIADRSDGEPLGYLLENRHIRAGAGRRR